MKWRDTHGRFAKGNEFAAVPPRIVVRKPRSGEPSRRCNHCRGRWSLDSFDGAERRCRQCRAERRRELRRGAQPRTPWGLQLEGWYGSLAKLLAEEGRESTS